LLIELQLVFKAVYVTGSSQCVEDVDALIAATAMARGLTLVTRDRDFERLIDLNLKFELRSEA